MSDIFVQAFDNSVYGILRSPGKSAGFAPRRKVNQSTDPRHGKTCRTCHVTMPMTGECWNCEN